MITRLDSASARKLSAGQVITDLSSVLKELVENSLDARASAITVRIENYGLGKIVVDDDGTGIELGNFLLTDDGSVKDGVSVPLLVHRATTKHQPSADSPAVEQTGDSLGFRGEALHSLANLSVVTIHTMTAESQPATLSITYDSRAHHLSVKATRERKDPGTTVIVDDLFAALPVRRGEFNKNKKKQLSAATSLIKQYSLSHPHVRLLMLHQVSLQSAPATLVSLSGTSDTQRALAEAYGGRYLSEMMRVEWSFSFGTIVGFVSKVSSGRFSSDMQVLALDGRLVDLPVISKAISDAYAECQPNAAQRVCPIFFLHFHSVNDIPYDVNLTPNKRKVLFASDDNYAEEVRMQALKSFRASSEGISLDRHTRIEQTKQTELRAKQLEKLVRTPVSATSISLFTYRHVDAQPASPLGKDGSSSKVELSKMSSSLYNAHMEETGMKSKSCTPSTSTTLSSSQSSSSTSTSDNENAQQPRCAQKSERPEDLQDFLGKATKKKRTAEVDCSSGMGSNDDDDAGSASPEFLTDETNEQRPPGLCMTMWFPALSELAQQPLVHATTKSAVGPSRTRGRQQQTFPRLAEQTEEELSMYLDRSSFRELILHGQFNHGFILASLGDNMFVIDQHAADEKFNYESLVSRYVARPQPLLTSLPVLMDPQDVELAVQHSEELRKHGFIVRGGEETNKLLVSSVPVLQYEVVGPHDVMELVQQLALYGTIIKPIRSVWHSLATKACRSSIMIGTVLTEKTMRSVVSRLSDLDQPWNCPHGRPTLRHIASISSLMASGESAFAQE